MTSAADLSSEPQLLNIAEQLKVKDIEKEFTTTLTGSKHSPATSKNDLKNGNGIKKRTSNFNLKSLSNTNEERGSAQPMVNMLEDAERRTTGKILKLIKVKEEVFNKIPYKNQESFYKCYISTQFDDFLASTIVYFRYVLKHEKYQRMQNKVDQQRKTQKPWIFSAHVQKSHLQNVIIATDDQKNVALRYLGLKYAHLLLEHCRMQESLKERRFFESLFMFTFEFLKCIYTTTSYFPRIEQEVNRIFRSDSFKSSIVPKPRDTLDRMAAINSLLKQENRSLRESKDASGSLSKYARDKSKFSVQNVLNTRSPLISSLFPSKIESTYLSRKSKQALESTDNGAKKKVGSRKIDTPTFPNIGTDNTRKLEEAMDEFDRVQVSTEVNYRGVSEYIIRIGGLARGS